jgi:predicted ester cyclase
MERRPPTRREILASDDERRHTTSQPRTTRYGSDPRGRARAHRPGRSRSRRYFAPDFAFHGPDGAELDYEGLKGYFASLRAAFDDLTISREIIVVEGDYVACQTTITGTFVREFTHSPVGSLPPTGSRVVLELINIFRYDDQGRLAEEWVQTDNRSRLRQLGADGC